MRKIVENDNANIFLDNAVLRHALGATIRQDEALLPIPTALKPQRISKISQLLDYIARFRA
jgi:hypothetical protein